MFCYFTYLFNEVLTQHQNRRFKNYPKIFCKNYFVLRDRLWLYIVNIKPTKNDLKWKNVIFSFTIKKYGGGGRLKIPSDNKRGKSSPGTAGGTNKILSKIRENPLKRCQKWKGGSGGRGDSRFYIFWTAAHAHWALFLNKKKMQCSLTKWLQP